MYTLLQHPANSYLEVLLYFSTEEVNLLENIAGLSYETSFLKIYKRKIQEKLECCDIPFPNLIVYFKCVIYVAIARSIHLEMLNL